MDLYVENEKITSCSTIPYLSTGSCTSAPVNTRVQPLRTDVTVYRCTDRILQMERLGGSISCSSVDTSAPGGGWMGSEEGVDGE